MRFSIFYLQVDTCFFFEFCNLGFDIIHGIYFLVDNLLKVVFYSSMRFPRLAPASARKASEQPRRMRDAGTSGVMSAPKNAMGVPTVSLRISAVVGVVPRSEARKRFMMWSGYVVGFDDHVDCLLGGVYHSPSSR